MINNNKQKLIIICFIISLISSSCKNLSFQNIDDLINKNTIDHNITNDKNFNNNIQDNQNSQNKQYKYMINTNTKKVHTFTHGDSIIKNENNKYATNSDVIELLKNDEYDICRTCYAGLKVIKDFEKNYSVDLIEKFMRLYDFIELEEGRQEFVYCIFEVGAWYVDNVYTYQGAHKVKREIDVMSKDASDNAKNIWNVKRASFSDTEFVMRATSDDVDDNNKYLNNDAIYVCDMFNDYDKKEVADDCSKFVTAVYYHYFNRIKHKEKAKVFNLKFTGSYSYHKINTDIMKTLEKDKIFKHYTIDSIKYFEKYLNKNFELEVGDAIYRHRFYSNTKKQNIPSHIEFYIGNNKIISWGKVHKSFYLIKSFVKNDNGFCSDDTYEEGQPYISVIRFNGGNYEE